MRRKILILVPARTRIGRRAPGNIIMSDKLKDVRQGKERPERGSALRSDAK